MKVLLVGAGGREHALARALVRTSDSVDLVVQVGNPGISSLGTPVAFDGSDPEAVADTARDHGVDLVVVGPEAPLVAGVADAVRAAGIPCFGPSRSAAQLEASKSFAKDVMSAAGVATARSITCRAPQDVDAALGEFGAPHVVKDDALAAGKGVVVTSDLQTARTHALRCLSRPGGAVVVEEFLDGPEVSLFCLCDGTRAVPLAPAQDFKRLRTGNQGPNTGGMGAYSPLPWLPPGVTDHVVRTVAEPTLAEMSGRGAPFVGLLYCGLALTSAGVRVVEFNVRFGDPETQVVLERLESPLANALLAAATGALDGLGALTWSTDAAVTVVMASPGYPVAPRTGEPISGVADAESLPGVHVLQAGTASADTEEGSHLVTAGGRVLDVVGRGATLEEARARAYHGVASVHFDGEQHRTDIATWPSGLADDLASTLTPTLTGVSH